MNQELSPKIIRTHIAILSKKWKLLSKIISGDKTIESRWYLNKVAPWNKINAGDTVYFKDSGEPITCIAKVSKVLQFKNLTNEVIFSILRKYGNRIGLNIPTNETELSSFYKKKRYCVLIFLKDVKEIKPFSINKSGYGISSAWLIVDDINSVKCESQ